MSVNISIENLEKRYDGNVIIPDLSININDGEFFTLLGPSGCGKTTLLRMIAGFNSIESGQIRFDEQVINGIPAHERNIGMVFQSYAIFPHMTVYQNVEYGLKLRKISKTEIKRRVDEILDIVKIEQYRDRLPEHLSGGQQQRVALARAIVIHPTVLLMDEPLSNLDAKLRIEMRSAIREIQKKVGITTVYVTHDQEEALAISDRIAVMKDGRIQQLGRPEAIYSRPQNTFTATFVGHSNLIRGRLKVAGGQAAVIFKSGHHILVPSVDKSAVDGMEVIAAVRPEEFTVAGEGIPAIVRSRTFLGKYVQYELESERLGVIGESGILEFSQDVGTAERLYNEGDEIKLGINVHKFNVFSEDGTVSLTQGVKTYE